MKRLVVVHNRYGGPVVVLHASLYRSVALAHESQASGRATRGLPSFGRVARGSEGLWPYGSTPTEVG
jgi:hypothetical protein